MPDNYQEIKKILLEKAFLVINAQIFHLSKTVTKIGRMLDNNVVIQKSQISRHHAEIHYKNNDFILVDNNSSGGTFINNKRIVKETLKSGDIILFANLPVMFMYEGSELRAQTNLKTDDLPPLEQFIDKENDKNIESDQ